MHVRMCLRVYLFVCARACLNIHACMYMCVSKVSMCVRKSMSACLFMFYSEYMRVEMRVSVYVYTCTSVIVSIREFVYFDYV